MERRAWYKERHQARVAEAKQDKRQIKSTNNVFVSYGKGKQDRTGQDRTGQKQNNNYTGIRIEESKQNNLQQQKQQSPLLPSFSFLFFSSVRNKE
jgi:hypothetical protein